MYPIALFAGGWNNNGQQTVVDLYDFASNTWSTATLLNLVILQSYFCEQYRSYLCRG